MSKIFANYDRYIISEETCGFLKEQLEAFEKVADAVTPHKGTSFYVSVNMRPGYVRLNVGGEDVVKAMWCVRKILRNVKENFQYEERNGPNGTPKLSSKNRTASWLCSRSTAVTFSAKTEYLQNQA